MTCDQCPAPVFACTVGSDGFNAVARSPDGNAMVVCPIVAPVADRHWCAACWAKRFGAERAA